MKSGTDKPAPSRRPMPSKLAETALKRVLKTSPQDLWLDTIRRADWGTHDNLVYWMLNQTECDFAIAAHAFYRSEPTHHIDNPKSLPIRPTPSQIFALVLLNWDKGYYRTHQLRVEDSDANPRLVARLNQKLMAWPRGSLPFIVPARLLQPQGGDAVELPPHLSPDDAAHLWPLYAGMGLRVPRAAPGLQRRVAKAKGFIDKIGFRTARM